MFLHLWKSMKYHLLCLKVICGLLGKNGNLLHVQASYSVFPNTLFVPSPKKRQGTKLFSVMKRGDFQFRNSRRGQSILQLWGTKLLKVLVSNNSTMVPQQAYCLMQSSLELKKKTNFSLPLSPQSLNVLLIHSVLLLEWSKYFLLVQLFRFSGSSFVGFSKSKLSIRLISLKFILII